MDKNIEMKANALKSINEITLNNEIVIFGSTYMANFPFYELVNKYKLENAIYNRSIERLTLDDALEIVKSCVIDLKPEKIFIALGEEDYEKDGAIKKYNKLVGVIRSQLPQVKLFLICLTQKDEKAKKFNENILALCNGKNVQLIKLTDKECSETEKYKLRFKELSCFFRAKPLNMSDAFLMAT